MDTDMEVLPELIATHSHALLHACEPSASSLFLGEKLHQQPARKRSSQTQISKKLEESLTDYRGSECILGGIVLWNYTGNFS